MHIFVGLGNPGSQYTGHRHNVGFMAVEAVASAHGFGPERKRFQGLTNDGFLEAQGARHKALLLRPQTFMNESGRSVGEAMRFFKLAPADVTVFYDEIDLAPGRLRVKTGGGAAGHNGIRSIASHIGPEFRRVRIGVGHPGSKDRVSGYVLSDFAKADRTWLDPLLEAIGRHAPLLLADESTFMTRVAADAPAPAKPKPGEAKTDGV